jgi:hypothetical protein
MKSEDSSSKAVTLAGEGQKVFVAAVFAFHTGKAIAQIAAIKITVIDLMGYAPSAGKKFLRRCMA